MLRVALRIGELKPYLVFQDDLSCHQCLPCPLAFLDDGVPQQLGCLVHAGVQLHQRGANTPAQQLILPLVGAIEIRYKTPTAT